MLFTVEMNTSVLETNMLKRVFELQPHAHSELPATSKQIYVQMIAIVTFVYLQNRCYHVEEIQNVSRCTRAFSVALN